MEEPKSFEQIREETEQAQRTTLWPDNLRNTKTVYAFLWQGDPNAKIVQRVGLIVFALFFLIWAVYILSSFAEAQPEDRSALGLMAGLVFALISVHLIRNAFLKRQTSSEAPDDKEIV
jgi:hypothetical protein